MSRSLWFFSRLRRGACVHLVVVCISPFLSISFPSVGDPVTRFAYCRVGGLPRFGSPVPLFAFCGVVGLVRGGGGELMMLDLFFVVVLRSRPCIPIAIWRSSGVFRYSSFWFFGNCIWHGAVCGDLGRLSQLYGLSQLPIGMLVRRSASHRSSTGDLDRDLSWFSRRYHGPVLLGICGLGRCASSVRVDFVGCRRRFLIRGVLVFRIRF